MTAVRSARPSAHPNPILDSTQKKVAISARATSANTAKNRMPSNGNDHPWQSRPRARHPGTGQDLSPTPDTFGA